jgi:coronin-1B/1C/6
MAAGRYVRSSSYRHVFGTPAKEPFLGLIPACSGEGNFVAANTKFFAVPIAGGGGPVVVHPLTKPGRFGAKVPQLAVHKYAVSDLQFHPFIETLIATGDEGAAIRVSKIPDGGLTEDVTESLVSLEGHSKKITLLNFNPVANNILGSVSPDGTARVWDIEAQSEVLNWELPETNPLSLEWNRNGSLLAIHGKDQKFRVYDPRDSKAAQTATGFSGNKKSTILFADNLGLYVGLGGNSRAQRQYGVWDPKKLDAPLEIVDIDSSAGTFVAFYDQDNSILWAAGKGDASIRYFEVVASTPQEKKHIHALSEFRDSSSQQGGCFLPKRACDVTKCEIAVFLRIVKEKSAVIPVSFQVPRKSDLFQKDLYPDAYAGVAALEAKEWIAGQNADPKTKSMNPKEKGGDQQAAAAFHVQAKKSYAELEDEVVKLTARVKELEAQLAKK